MNEKGFTIIEVTICLALLVIVVLGMVSLTAENLYVEQGKKEKALALNHARKRLENIISRPYGEIVQDDADPDLCSNFNVSEHNITLNTLPGTASVGTCTISPEVNGVKNVQLIIQWRTARDRRLSVQLETFVTEYH